MNYFNNNIIEQARAAAFGWVISSLNMSKSFPDQVFNTYDLEFKFFEADKVFASSFTDVISDFLSLENSTSACLLNISRTKTKDYTAAEAIFIESQTSSIVYDAQLRLGGPSTGWLFSMDHYGCASDTGSWIIYCEKENEVAVVALRGSGATERFSSPLRKMGAETIGLLIQQGSSSPFPFSALVPSWRDGLSRRYGAK